MKKNFSLLLLAFMACYYLNAQEGKLAPADEGPCPPGMCVVKAGFVIDVFNFHKPKTECKSGFGLCIKLHIGYSCGYPPYCITPLGKQAGAITKIEKNRVTGWVEIKDKVAVIHLPLGIETQPGFEKTDLRLFSIESDMVFFENDKGITTLKARPGNYNVKRNADDLVIVVDLEKIW